MGIHTIRVWSDRVDILIRSDFLPVFLPTKQKLGKEIKMIFY